MIKYINVRPETQSIKGIDQVNTPMCGLRPGNSKRALLAQPTPVVDKWNSRELQT